MRQPAETTPFPYYVGVQSLEELVDKSSRVCVLNMLGTESRTVTPVSHAYSGGNIVAGVQYGRKGELETPIGNIPAYPSVREVMEAGHRFDIGVIYLPPSAVAQAASELISFNKELKKIIILTEKVAVKDSYNIRTLAQEAHVDVIGANCLGVANAWDHVRVGGALGGDKPEESMTKGSIALHSNSGNFTTTIAEYLKTAGFGISTAVSSGKDVVIQFALAEFLYAAQNDHRTKAVVAYVEPGGYYENIALEMIKDKKFRFTKPIVACVTGRWKKNLQRACGHAGAMAGGGDDAEAKEKWFDNYFGVGEFDPKSSTVSERGVRVSSIQHIPDAMRAIYEKLGDKLDFPSTGDLSLKPWLADTFISLPPELGLPVVEAMAPYNEQIKKANKEVGAHYLRQNMRNKSGASKMNRQTFVAEIHGTPILDLANHSMEENIYFQLAKVMPDKEDIPTINTLLNIFLKINPERMEGVDVGKANSCSPNAYIASQIALVGNKSFLEKARQQTKLIIDVIREFGLDEYHMDIPKELDAYVIEHMLTNEEVCKTDISDLLYKEVKGNTKEYIAIKVCRHIIELAEAKKMNIRNSYEFLLASVAVGIFWKPMLEKHMSRQTVEDAVTYFYILSRTVAYSVIDWKNNQYWTKLIDSKLSNLTDSFTENAFKILFAREPSETEFYEFRTLMGLTLSNGPGTISAKGAKSSVSARNHISMCYIGFLANTGFAHGGNGFEAVAYLLKKFADSEIGSPGDKDHGIDLQALAQKAAKEYGIFKKQAKLEGQLKYTRIPCVNHPVFKGNAVNIDPREAYVSSQFEKKGMYNIFLDFYHNLVQELYNEGVTKNVFCVNVDAVLAVISLKLLWNDLRAGKFTDQQVQDLVFTMFLFGRSIGVTSELADHRDRGQDMDCRTPESQLTFVL